MATTHTITYTYDVDGKLIKLTRRHTGTAYAANGNVGNPTEYFVWDAEVDGRTVATAGSRAGAYELALGNSIIASDNRTVIGGNRARVRNWVKVRDEMKANLVGSARVACTCGALDFPICTCGISLHDFLATGGGRRP